MRTEPHTDIGRTEPRKNILGLILWLNDAGKDVSKWRDQSGRDNNGTIYGATTPPATSSDAFGYLFNGIDGYVSVENEASLNVTNAITIGGWIKRGTNITWRCIISKGESGLDANHNYLLEISSTNKLYLAFGNNDNITYRYFQTTDAIDTNWHYIVGIINSATDMKIYVDGLSWAGTYNGSTSAILTPNSKKILIGSSSATSGFWNGYIGEVRVYNRALSASEIKLFFQKYRSKFGI